MGIETDLNVSPYYDDYDETKNYQKVLFKPAVALQARELTQLQTILQNQVERFGGHLFKEGAIIKGCVFNFNRSIEYVKVLDKTIAGTDLNVGLIGTGSFLRGTVANLVSRVVDTASGLETQNPDLNTLFFNYISSDNTTKVYESGEILEVYPSTTSIANIQPTARGTGYTNDDTVTISSTNGGNAVATVNVFSNGTIESINMTANGAGFTVDDYPTATVVSTNTSASGATLRVNLEETMRVTVGNNAALIAGNESNSQFQVTGKAFQMSVGDGVIFQKGVFQRFAEQDIIVSKYTNRPNELVVGVQTTETTVNNSVDTSLLDNASGFANENAPGADRLKLTPTLVVNTKANAEASNNFLKMAAFQNGQVVQKNQTAALNEFGETIARRTYEESGDYVVEPFTLSTENIVGNTSHLIATVGKGVGYVQGKRFELTGTSRVSMPKATAFNTKEDQQVSVNYGNFVEVDEFVGQFGTANGDLLLVLDSAMDAISGSASGANGFTAASHASNTQVTYDGVTANIIGTARVKGVEQKGDIPGKANTQYKVFLDDITMEAGKAFKSDAKSLWHYKSAEYDPSSGRKETNEAFDGVADIVLNSNKAELKDAGAKTLVFPTGQKGVKSVDVASYKYRDRTTATVAQTGNIAITTSNSSFTFGVGSTGYVSESNLKRFIVTPLESKDSVNISTAADVDGTSTTLVTGANTDGSGGVPVLKPGHFVKIDSTIRQINNIVNSTAFNTTVNVGVDHNGDGVVKRHFPAFYPLSFTDHAAANLEIGSSGSQITINIGATLAGTNTMNIAVMHDVLASGDGKEAGKVKSIKTTEVGIDCGANTTVQPGQTTGPWCLGVPDAFELLSVFVGPDNTYTSVAEADWTDVTSKFEIVPNQKDGHYGLSKLRIKPSSNYTIGSDDHIAVKFRHFDLSSGTGFFHFGSYSGIIDDTNPDSATKITTQEVPVFTSPSSGREYSLRDSIDFRNYVANTATKEGAFANGIGTATENPSNVENFNFTTVQNVVVPDSLWSANVSYYLPRKDRLVIERGGLRLVTGRPSTSPQLPAKPPRAMQLATYDVPVYPTLDVLNAKFYRRPDLAVKIRASQLKRYTMKDIKTLDDRITNLEYYTSLNLLEKMTSDSVLPGRTDPTLNRFKNGFIVDNFTSIAVGNPLNKEYKAGFDVARQKLTAKFEQYHIKMKYESGAAISKTGDLILPGFKQMELLNQNKATQSRRCTSQFWKYNGQLEIFPNYISYIDDSRPAQNPVQIDVDVAAGTLALIEEMNKVMPNQFTSDELIGSETETRLTGSTETDTQRTDTFETVTEHTFRRTETTVTATSSTTTKKVGEFITNIALQPYIPGVNIYFYALGLRPNLRHHVFFDDVNINEHVTPSKVYNSIDELEPLKTASSDNAAKYFFKSGAKGDSLTANSTGGLSGMIRLPENKFFAGERKIVLTDVDNLTQARDTVSAATARFNCYNFSVETTDLIVSTRTPEITASQSTTIFGTQTVTSEDVVTTIPSGNNSNNDANTANTANTANNDGSNTGGGGTSNTGGGTGDTSNGSTNAAANTTNPPSIGRPIPIDPCVEFNRARNDAREFGNEGLFFDVIDNEFDCGRDYDDPLAQTFKLERTMFRGSEQGYLTSIDLYFAEKDPNLGVTIELRDVINGSPGPNVLPFSRVRLSSSDVATSTDGSSKTTINFKSPVAVDTNKEYCFVILPEANSPSYKVYTAKAGQNDLNTGIQVNQDWGMGTMFLSTNNRSWTEYLDEDCKFTVYAAFFNNTHGQVNLVNEDYEFFTANNGTINGTFEQAEEVFKLAANAAGTITFSKGSSTITGSSTTFTGLSAGDKIVLTSNTSLFDVVEVNSVSSATSMTIRGGAKFSDGGTGKYMHTPVGNFVKLDENTSTLLINDSTATNSTFLFANQDVIIGCDSLANTTIDAPVNTNISYYEPRVYKLEGPQTEVVTELGATNASTARIRTNDRTYPIEHGETLQVKSKSNEISGTDVVKSLHMKHFLTSKSRYTAPCIDLQSQGVLIYENVINNDVTNEHLSGQGSASSKYVSRIVTLADGLDAEDIKVFVNAYRPANTDVKVYARILNETDTTNIDDGNWSLLQMTQNENKFSSDVDRQDIIEYGYEFADTLETTTTDAIATLDTDGKTVITSSNVDSTFAVNDLMKLTQGDEDTDYQISKVTAKAANGTSFTIADNCFVNSSVITVSRVNDDQIYRAFRDPQAPTAFTVSYYNEDQERFVGYKRLAIKIVMTSESTDKAPALTNYRAIAVSL